MMLRKFYSRILDWYTDNTLVALIPEWWALETLLELQKQLVILPLVNRDYDKYFAEAGNVVNLNRTGNFTAVRKQKGSKVTVQPVTASGDTVMLNQHFHVSYYLDDQDERATMGALRPKYITKAAIALAEAMDMVMLGETYNFLENVAGKVGTDLLDQPVRDLAEIFTRNNCPRAGRNCIVGAASENMLLGIDRFVEARMIGDGQAIRNNLLGHMRGFDFFVASQVPEVSTTTTTVTDAHVEGAHAAGSSVLLITEGAAPPTVGRWLTIAGDLQPHRITAYTDLGATGNMTITPPLNYSVVDSAVITLYTSGAVNHPTAGTYPYQHSDKIEVDGGIAEGQLKVGQGISFASDAYRYTIMGVEISGGNVISIILNRPLDAAVANNCVLNPIPPANYNLAFMRDALTFVNRPLKPAEAGTGVNAAWNSYNGIAIRVTIGYDQDYMGQKVTLDTLCGVKTLDTSMGGVLLS
jgi:hypothetical protein